MSTTALVRLDLLNLYTGGKNRANYQLDISLNLAWLFAEVDIVEMCIKQLYLFSLTLCVLLFTFG